ncbi:MAG TPA: hypothetical protein DEG96_08335, partial [Candidatus Atribacteria bacterium]|nr:hypothetical protein [Candidatus Atribacteria bacterium]
GLARGYLFTVLFIDSKNSQPKGAERKVLIKPMAIAACKLKKLGAIYGPANIWDMQFFKDLNRFVSS